MKRVNQQEINKFLKLYNKYSSLRKVGNLSGRSVNTVKRHLKGKVNFNVKNIVTKLNSADNLLVGTYVGLWMGDGTQFYEKRYTVKFCCNKKQTRLNEFIQLVVLKLFNKQSNLILENDTNRAYIKFYSKFIYHFIDDYVTIKEGKTFSVRLKKDTEEYPPEFLKGALLGLSLSDGYLKDRFQFNVVSNDLSDNLSDILRKFNFNPHKYTHNREKWGWKDLHMISLNRRESQLLLRLLNRTVKKIDSSSNFLKLKYGPAVI